MKAASPLDTKEVQPRRRTGGAGADVLAIGAQKTDWTVLKTAATDLPPPGQSR